MPVFRGPRLDVAGRVAMITGAGHGIGLALTRLLHARGATVAVLDVDADAAEAAAGTLGNERVIAIGADVRDRDAVASAVAEVAKRCGGVDVAVANAGVPPPVATLRTIDPDAFDDVLAVNLTGVFNTVRASIEPVIERRGHIVVVSSVAAFVAGAGTSPYLVSKAGVEQLGRALRIELAPHGATAGVAYFGIVATRMTHDTIDADPLVSRATRRVPRSLRRRISPEQAAAAVADGIERRADRTIAPRAWKAWAIGRGVINPVVDRLLTREADDTWGLLREIEARGGSHRPDAGS
jgi:NAD(P)-dependent dehydrogenase (short-subunit alcohol dehydrogenase family)